MPASSQGLSTLGDQLWVYLQPEPPTPARLEPIRNDPTHHRPEQPRGGLWTATYDPVTYSSWAQVLHRCEGAYGLTWARQRAASWPEIQRRGITQALIGGTIFYRAGRFHVPAWRLTPDPAARIWTLATPADFARLLAAYEVTAPGQRPYLDYEAMSEAWDAVHLTPAGVAVIFGHYRRFLEWYLESTLWFRWCFTAVSERLWIPMF
jgi:hypothetical protein